METDSRSRSPPLDLQRSNLKSMSLDGFVAQQDDNPAESFD